MKKISNGLLGQYNGRFVIAAKAIKDAQIERPGKKRSNRTWSSLNERWMEVGEPEYKAGDLVFLSAVDPVPAYLVGYPRWMSECEVWWNGAGLYSPYVVEEILKTYLGSSYLDSDKQYVDLASIEIFELGIK